MHHLHLRAGQSLRRIAATLAALSKKWLVFEYVSPDDSNVRRLSSTREGCYSLTTVKAALAEHFGDISVLPSDRETRSLLVARRETI